MQQKVLHHDSIKTLKKLIKKPEYHLSKDRIRALIMIQKNYPFQEISENLGYSSSWVYKLSEKYSTHGIEGILKQPRKGAEQLLNPNQIIDFYEIIFKGPPDDELLSRFRIKDLIKIVNDKWGVEYSVGGMHGLLKRMLLSHKTYRPHHPKNDPEIMEEWKKKRKNSLIKNENTTMLNFGIKTKHDMGKKELQRDYGTLKE